ncbi:hypothetical protein C8R45DRAFT_935855 [Mycena sanguinolenta]|nr:hypothetical protein C8R45DRAFT_935855 [Mycena sanguinolenta]
MATSFCRLPPFPPQVFAASVGLALPAAAGLPSTVGRLPPPGARRACCRSALTVHRHRPACYGLLLITGVEGAWVAPADLAAQKGWMPSLMINALYQANSCLTPQVVGREAWAFHDPSWMTLKHKYWPMDVTRVIGSNRIILGVIARSIHCVVNPRDSLIVRLDEPTDLICSIALKASTLTPHSIHGVWYSFDVVPEMAHGIAVSTCLDQCINLIWGAELEKGIIGVIVQLIYRVWYQARLGLANDQLNTASCLKPSAE